MSMSLRENITAVIETCFSETKDEIQDMAINRILELIRADRKTESQTEYPCNTCANKGDHNDECSNCIVDSETIRWKTPSHYKSKTEL